MNEVQGELEETPFNLFSEEQKDGAALLAAKIEKEEAKRAANAAQGVFLLE